MCGRYAITLPPEAMTGLFDLDAPAPEMRPRYNVAPSQDIPVILHDPDVGRVCAMRRWGLHPFWLKEPPGAKSMINARAEGAAAKPFFRDAYKKRRCLIPADGFYEWKRKGAVKTPYFIQPKAGGVLAFAGLWERWSAPDGAEVLTAAILTVAANAALQPLHDRMPAILPPDAWSLWLDPKAPMEPLGWMLAPAPEDALAFYAVSRAVNAPGRDGPELILPA
jgi:putative SOS response-associated peptidase YedK